MYVFHWGRHWVSIEILIWLGAAAFGWVVSLVQIIQARLDLQDVQTYSINGAKHVIAKGNLRREVFRHFQQILFLVVGIAVVVTPLPAPLKHPPPETALSHVLASCLILAAASVGVNTFLDASDRRRALEEVAKRG